MVGTIIFIVNILVGFILGWYARSSIDDCYRGCRGEKLEGLCCDKQLLPRKHTRQAIKDGLRMEKDKCYSH